MNKDNSTPPLGLRIRLFGGLEVRNSRGVVQSFATKKSELLFSFLVLNANRVFYRDSLLERFFTDEPTASARKNLRTIIWQIRSVLEPTGTEPGTYLIVNNREVGFNGQSSYWLDCHEFRSGLSQSLKDIKTEKLVDLLGLYRGEFLEGVSDCWCDSERDHLRTLYLTSLEALMHKQASSGTWLEAIRLGEKIVEEDPFKEHVYRHLMKYYYFLGDRPSALLKYQACVRVLRDELDIEPMAKTMQLFRDIQNECVSGPALTSVASGKPLDQAAPSADVTIDSLSDQLKRMEAKLSVSLELIEKLTVNS